MLSMIRREPVGVVAAITPWNFPLLEVAYKLGPALAAGCTVVVKPSELAPLSTLRLMDLAEEAGLPPGVVNAIIGGPDVGAALVAHPAVAKVAFTGQTATGIDPATEMGPLISANHRRRVLGHVASARDDGAQVAVGGGEASPDGLEHGFFVEPTVVRGVSNSMRVAQEEIFGPVLSVISWRSDSDLAALANAVPYGLAAGIWTSDTSRALRLAEELEAGTVWINTYGMFDVAVPFGGRKHSGFGRELGEEALEPYLTSKSVWVDLQSAAAQAGQAISR
jgi:acyl-CoA reductase-like NAD-dependent aldehyde dehydrogenase